MGPGLLHPRNVVRLGSVPVSLSVSLFVHALKLVCGYGINVAHNFLCFEGYSFEKFLTRLLFKYT